MKKLLFIFLLCSSAFGQLRQKPMHGEQVNYGHPLGDFVGCWLFNEGSGNKVFDLSGNGNTGTLYGGMPWKSGKFGSALEFDGTNNYVDCGNSSSINLTTSHTIVVWLYQPSSAAASSYVFYACRRGVGGNNFQTYITASDGTPAFELRYWNGTTVISSGISITQDTWYQIAWVHDGTNINFYINGVLRNTQALALGASSTENTYIGWDTSSYCNALLDNMAIYNHPLSSPEIALLHREPFCMFDRDDVAITAKAAEVPTGGQVIIIQMGAATFGMALAACSLLWLNRKAA